MAQLRTELADARQETSVATEALTASTELAGRLQAHAEIAREQGAAAVQRVTHEHRRATVDLEHRLQQATAALQHTSAAAASADAQQRETIQTLQQRLEAALTQSNAAAAQLQTQLDSATSTTALQAAASQEAVAHMQAQVDALHHQLTTAGQAAAATETGVDTAVSVGQTAMREAPSQHAELQQKLEEAEARLHRMTAADAAAETDRRQVVQALQHQLAETGEQVLVAQGQVFDSAGAIAELEHQLGAAQDAINQQAETSTSTVQHLQTQVEDEASLIAECRVYCVMRPCSLFGHSCHVSLESGHSARNAEQVVCAMVLPSQST